MKRKLFNGSMYAFLGVVFLSFVALTLLTNHAGDDLYDHIDDEVIETYQYFKMAPDDYKASIVYYPGGLVTPESYLLQAQYLYAHNYRVIIPKMPLNLAILNRFAYLDIYEPDGKPWFLMGHSLGGASMAYVAEDHDHKIDGLIFIASYPPNSVDLRALEIPTLSITASNDAVIDLEQFHSTQSLLPQDTDFKDIDGGNHAQFGYYGSQRGDGEASISVFDQHEQTTQRITDFIENLLD